MNFTKVFVPRQVPCVRPTGQPGQGAQRVLACSPSRRESRPADHVRPPLGGQPARCPFSSTRDKARVGGPGREPVGVLPVGPLLPSGSSGERGRAAGTSPGAGPEDDPQTPLSLPEEAPPSQRRRSPRTQERAVRYRRPAGGRPGRGKPTGFSRPGPQERASPAFPVSAQRRPGRVEVTGG